MGIKKSSKPKKIDSPGGEIVDSVLANLGDDKTSHASDTEQARPVPSDPVGWSPESGKRKRWVGWDDWDSLHDL
jgi:hypothetical protein